ncbi:GTPase [Serratia fonticola]|uniref:GTPase n=1 Tax=Serratia fonticola TaxID=47917 RepID=A0AAJ1YGA1_SERFO|nr:GTPase [Serratia fonticola]MDQ9127399.1 GTPase [Serratia fonticola]
MPNIPNPHPPADTLRACLTLLPQQATDRILTHLQQVIHYEPVIGVMGKSGAGKSSLCNALFQQPVCLTNDLTACTREPQRLVLSVGDRNMTLVDLPGVGETPEYDAEYLTLYRDLLAELDLIIWVLRADERARAVDIVTYRALLAQGADPSRFLFVLSQADRIPPAHEWDEAQAIPSATQLLAMAVVCTQVANQLPSSFPVMAVSARTGYNLPAFVALMVHALPVQASSAVYRQIKLENRSVDSETAVRQDFGEAAGKVFDSVIDPLSLPSGLTVLLRRLRRKLVRLAIRLWDRLFG